MNFYTSIFKSKINYKSSLKYFFIFLFFLLNLVALFNYVIDPFWMFKQSNSLNQKQIDFHEREQKTNYLIYNKKDYNGLLLGSSRSTYINQDFFSKYRFFNYSANGMYPREFEYFIDTFTKVVKNEPKKIILAMDFFSIFLDNVHTDEKFTAKYYENSNDKFYRLKMLYNFKILKFSFRNLKQNFKIKKNYYNRELTKYHKKIPEKEIAIKIEQTLRHLKNVNYDNSLKDYFTNLKSKYNSNFTIFITPVTFKQIETYHKLGLDKYYFRWLKELIDVFGGVYNFMIPSEFTKNNSNFFDSNHATEKSLEYLIEVLDNDNKISGKNFIYLTKNNFDSFKLNYLKEIN